MFARTHTAESPWTVIRTNDKRRGRINALRTLLGQLDYTGKDPAVVKQPDPAIVGLGEFD